LSLAQTFGARDWRVLIGFVRGAIEQRHAHDRQLTQGAWQAAFTPHARQMAQPACRNGRTVQQHAVEMEDGTPLSADFGHECPRFVAIDIGIWDASHDAGFLAGYSR
jgi:hypothetical protein